MEKICVFCKWFRWHKMEYVFYGDYTGDEILGGPLCTHEDLGISRKMPNGQDIDDEDGFRAAILLAETCPGYSPP